MITGARRYGGIMFLSVVNEALSSVILQKTKQRKS